MEVSVRGVDVGIEQEPRRCWKDGADIECYEASLDDGGQGSGGQN